MSADQIAEIRPVIREAIAGAPDTCITLEVVGESDKWLQVVDCTINAAYPHESDAQQVLDTLPRLAGIQVASWEANTIATFEIESTEVSSLATWIDAYFVTILGCIDGEYHLDAKIERL
jgi:hypothetical protein